MTGTKRHRILLLLLGTLGLCACATAFAQSGAEAPAPRAIQIQSPSSGSLAGRLTDLHSAPLAGVSLVLRNRATGAELRTTTQKNGGFRVGALDAGEYTLEADDPRLGHGQLEGIVVSGGSEARVQAAILLQPGLPATAQGTSLAASVAGRNAAPASAAATQPAPSEAGVPAPAQVALPVASIGFMPQPAAAPPQTVSAPETPLIAAVTERAWPVVARSVPAPALQTSPSDELPEMIASVPMAPSTLPQPVANAPAVPQDRAALETQSAPIAPALALSVPHKLPLPEQIGPELLLSDAVATIQAAMAHSAARFEPVAAASEKPD